MKKLVLLGLALCLCAAAPAPKKAVPYDIVFANARVVDGTGAPWFAADVGVRGG
jgi:N-acyl-D-amino-acid deacylase